MLRLIAMLCVFFFVKDSVSQNNDPLVNKNRTKSVITDSSIKNKPEIFSSGFIDIINNGQINASARMVRLYIGEPDKITIPLSFYGGVSNNNFQNQTSSGSLIKSNDHLVNQYINPLSGLVNVSIDGIVFFKKNEKYLITKTGLLYHIGERVLNGVRIGQLSNPLTGRQTNFLNSFGSLGLYFQTGAWEKTNSDNLGIFWVAARYHMCKSNPNQIKQFLPDVVTNGLYKGYSFGLGIEINKVVNIKAIYYKYTKPPEIDYGLPIYQFSFNYAVK